MKKKGLRRTITCAFMAGLFALGGALGGGSRSEAAGGVKIDSTNFPDKIFRTYVKANFDMDGNGTLSSSEIAEAKAIDLSTYYDETIDNAKSIKGIEYLTYLESFYYFGDELTSADFSKNTNMKRIGFDRVYYLKSVNVKGCTKLEYLSVCNANSLTSIDVSTNKGLTSLIIAQSKLSSIDISKNTKLKELRLIDNSISKLDIKNHVLIEELETHGSKITSLDVSTLSNLQCIDIGNSPIKSIDLTKNKKLIEVYADYCSELTSIKLASNNIRKIYLNASPKLKSVDITKCSKLLNLFKNKKVLVAWNGEEYIWNSENDLDMTYNYDVDKLWVDQSLVIVYSADQFQKQPDGSWAYIVNGALSNKTDVMKATVNGQSAWWYIKNGKVQTGNTVAKNSSGWWVIQKGKVNFGFNGFAKNDSGWWYCKGGKVQFDKTDVIQGTVNGQSGWWYVKKGQVQFVDSVEKNSSGWWVIQKGKVNFSFTGIAKNANGYWYCKNGKVQFIDTVAQNSSGWWAIRNGKVDFNFTGIAKNDKGSWYCKGGKVQFGYTGKVTYNGKTYNIKGGKVQ